MTFMGGDPGKPLFAFQVVGVDSRKRHFAFARLLDSFNQSASFAIEAAMESATVAQQDDEFGASDWRAVRGVCEFNLDSVFSAARRKSADSRGRQCRQTKIVRRERMLGAGRMHSPRNRRNPVGQSERQ